MHQEICLLYLDQQNQSQVKAYEDYPNGKSSQAYLFRVI